MKRERRVALLVGLAFIALFGMVLGQRSLRLAAESDSGQPPLGIVPPPQLAGPELAAASMDRRDETPELAARTTPPPTSDQANCEDGSLRLPSLAARQDLPQPLERTPPAQPARPAAQPARTYRVMAGDTLIRIARKVYGREHEREHLRIFAANRDKLPSASQVAVGQVLLIPPLEAASPRRAVSPPGVWRRENYTEMTLPALEGRFRRGRTYVVRAGDTLTDIARRQMGSAAGSAVRKLLEANPDRIRDPDRLPVGLRLRIPNGA